jgi:GET complex subunit GET2
MQPPKPKTLLQKLLPLLHLLSMVGIILFFIVWEEPRQFIATMNQQGGQGVVDVTDKFGWSRWETLSKSRRSPLKMGTTVLSLVCIVFGRSL